MQELVEPVCAFRCFVK